MVNSNCIVVEGDALEGIMSQVFERLRVNNHDKDNGIMWLLLVQFIHWKKSLGVINH